MLVAMVTTTGDRCGIAAYTRALSDALNNLPDVFVEVFPITEGRQPHSHYEALADRLNSSGADIVHIQHEHSFWGGVMPNASAFAEFRALITKPVVLTAHTTYSLSDLLRVREERRPVKLIAKRLLLLNSRYRRSVDTDPFNGRTIVHTGAARDELIARGLTAGKVCVVPTGVPAPVSASASAERFVRKYGLQGKRLLVIFGYIAPNKGYELTLSIINRIPKDVVLVIAGGARNSDMEPYVASLSSTIAESAASDRVLVTGYLSDVEIADVMAAATLVLTPHTQATGSYSVTLPITYGKAIVASTMDCFVDINRRVNCLELFISGDVEDYSRKLTALLGDPGRIYEREQQALEYARAYSWDAVARITRSVYDAELGGEAATNR